MGFSELGEELLEKVKDSRHTKSAIFTYFLHTIKWSFFPSFPANHENNPAANKADNTPDGK